MNPRFQSKVKAGSFDVVSSDGRIVLGGASFAGRTGGAAPACGCRGGFFFFEGETKSQTDCACRASCCAGAAADAFDRLRRLRRIDVHHADARAFAAVDAFFLVDGKSVKAKPIEQAVNRAERTERFAEKAIDEDGADEDDEQE